MRRSEALTGVAFGLPGIGLAVAGLAALPGLVIVPGAWLVHVDHIFAPTGVTGMGLIGLGKAWLAVLATKKASSSAQTPLPSPSAS